MVNNNKEVLNQEQNNFKKIVEQVVADYHLPVKKDEIDGWTFWKNSNNKELTKWGRKYWLVKDYTVDAKYLEEHVPHWWDDLISEMERGEKMDRVEEIIKHWKNRVEDAEETIKSLEDENALLDESAKCNLDAIKKCEEWERREKEKLRTQINNQADMIYKYTRELAEKEVAFKKLKEELMEEREERLRNGRELKEEIVTRKELQNKLYLTNKPLPKTPSKLKTLKEKTKTKIQQLVKKTKQQSQELIARIEVKTK